MSEVFENCPLDRCATTRSHTNSYTIRLNNVIFTDTKHFENRHSNQHIRACKQFLISQLISSSLIVDYVPKILKFKHILKIIFINH